MIAGARIFCVCPCAWVYIISLFVCSVLSYLFSQLYPAIRAQNYGASTYRNHNFPLLFPFFNEKHLQELRCVAMLCYEIVTILFYCQRFLYSLLYLQSSNFKKMGNYIYGHGNSYMPWEKRDMETATVETKASNDFCVKFFFVSSSSVLYIYLFYKITPFSNSQLMSMLMAGFFFCCFICSSSSSYSVSMKRGKY